MLPNILSLTLGKNKNKISRIIHQLSFITRPLTVLLTPPNTSPNGREGRGKGVGDAVFEGIKEESSLVTDGTAGAGVAAGAGGHTAGGGTLYIEDECLRPIFEASLHVNEGYEQTLNSII